MFFFFSVFYRVRHRFFIGFSTKKRDEESEASKETDDETEIETVRGSKILITFTHRNFTSRPFYTEKSVHKGCFHTFFFLLRLFPQLAKVFTLTKVYTEWFVHTGVVTFCTQQSLPTQRFMHRTFYTEKSLHRAVFTHGCFYRE